MVFIYMEFLGWYLTECHQMFVGIFESDAWVWWVVGFFGFFFFVCLEFFPTNEAD